MIDLRDLQFLSALARRRHFARAAEDCGVSQPAFSTRIRRLEERLGTAVVKRGNRFQRLTTEGEAILGHARRILDEVRALEQGVSAVRGDISATLVLGAIPTVSPFAAHVAARLRVAHPGIRVRIGSGTSLAVQQGVLDGLFDAGLTYSEGVASDRLTSEKLYEEAYTLFMPRGLRPESGDSISWKEAAELPLCLLEPGMQNRRIIDLVFEELGAAPNVVAETNEFTAAMVMAASGHAAVIVPNVLVDTLGAPAGTVAIPLDDPMVTRSISLVTSRRAPGIPAVEALKRTIVPTRRDNQS